MTGEDLFGDVTRTVLSDAGAFAADEHTVRSGGEAAPAAASARDDDEYSVVIQRGPAMAPAEQTVETALVPFRTEDVSDDWTEHKLLPGETRNQMVAQVRPTNASGAIEARRTIAQVVAATAPSASPSMLANDDPFKTAITSPSRAAPATEASPPAAAPGPVVAAPPAPPADARTWMDADAPTRACLELPEVQQKGAVFLPPAHAARPEEATRMWDPAIALQRAPEWTLDVRQIYRELRTRARNAWATRRRLCILAGAVALALAFTTGAALWPTRARPLAPVVRKQTRRPPTLHPSPGGDKAATPQELDLLIARAVIAYDTGRRVEAAEMFHTLGELQPDEQAWQFMSDILDRTNGGGNP